jgi:subtilisin-like proprotein convertase family protein
MKIPFHTSRIPGLPVLLVCTALSAAATQVTVSNTNTIIINDSTNPPTLATPYPSTMVVTGLTGTVLTKVTVGLFGITHTFPDDIDILLVGPQGQMAMILSNVGGDVRNSVTNINLTLDDDAADYLPLDSTLVSGTFKPTKKLQTLTFSFPAPCPPGSAAAPAPLSIFNGTDPSGTWQLFVLDDAYPDAGVITGGWSLTLTTVPLVLSISDAGPNVVLSWTNAASGYNLQTTTDLTSPATWTNAVPGPVQVSGQYMVTNAASDKARFYRLAR